MLYRLISPEHGSEQSVTESVALDMRPLLLPFCTRATSSILILGFICVGWILMPSTA